VPPALDANLGSFSQNTTGTTIALTTSAAAAAGTEILLGVHHNSPTVLVSSVSGGGLTWKKATEAKNGNFVNTIFSAPAPAGLAPSTVVTATLSGTPTAVGLICAASFSGVPDRLDATASNAQGSGTTWTATLITTSADALVYAMTEADTSTTGTDTAGSGTKVHDFTNTGYAAAIATQYLVPGVAGSQTINGTWAGLTGNSEKLTVIVAVGPGGVTPRTFNPIPFMR
jgi:hypothetical protein